MNIPIHKDILSGTLSVGFEDVDCFDWVFGISLGVSDFNTQQGLNSKLGEKLTLSANNFGGHRCLGSIEQGVLGEGIHGNSQHLCDVFDSLLAGKSQTIDNGGGVDFAIHELICSLVIILNSCMIILLHM